MMPNSPIISIITATFNRGYILEKLYLSLLDQDCYNFEWIIVDDGSQDETAKLLEEITSKPNPFPIKYLMQSNKGKHVAVNKGVKEANGEYIFIVDSDDILPSDSIKTVIKWIDETRNRKELAGIAGLKGNKISLERIGFFPKKIQQDGFIEQ